MPRVKIALRRFAQEHARVRERGVLSG